MEPTDEILKEHAREMYEALVAAHFIMGCENLYEQEGYIKTHNVLAKINPHEYEV